MSRAIHHLRGVRGKARRDHYAQQARDFDALVASDVKLLESDEFLGGTFRRSDELPKVTDAELFALDSMIERHGLARVLRSVRELCDSRGEAGVASDSFEAAEDSDEWKASADALESLLVTIKGLS
jgi:hypothetical protein